VVVLGAVLLFYSTRNAKASKAPAGASSGEVGGAGSAGKTPVDLFLVQKKPFTDALEGLVGTVKGDTIELTFNGQEERLTNVHVRLGQPVKKGQILFELDHTRAEARKNQAEIAYDRAKDLKEAGGATIKDVREAQAAYDIAKKDYDDTFIYAAKSGHMSEINKQVGETIGRSEVIGVLVSNEDKLVVETGVIESQLGKLSPGQKAEVRIDALGQKLEGRVLGVSREVTMTGRTGTVVIGLPAAVQAKLRPGMSASCRIILFNKETFVIPAKAYDKDRGGVYQVGDKNKVAFVPVTLGVLTDEHFEAVDGLKEGDKIVANLVAHPVQENAEVAPNEQYARYEPEEKSAKPGTP
ncbi:MAG: efflux RND transporter periplasmic adaptor subunit, partial [Elusimicrobia bacterium]|nr:efflux RND transporter periplasmic adaptor subunit [Elusimicrobiota bacterium]